MDEEDPTVCECGVPIDRHPPLPKPGPLRSWMAERHDRRDLAGEAMERIRAGGRKWAPSPSRKPRAA